MTYDYSIGIKKSLKFFFKNTSLNGCRYMVDDSRNFVERFVWFLLLLVTIIFTFRAVFTYYNGFIENPTLTQLKDFIPVDNIPFPGISICSINKISLRAVNKLRKFLFLWFLVQCSIFAATYRLVLMFWNGFLENPTLTELKNSRMPVENVNFPGISICSINKISRRATEKFRNYMLKNGLSEEESWKYINLIGLIFDYEKFSFDDLIPFQKLLDKYQLETENITKFNTNKFIYSMSVPCRELIQSCKWGNNRVECSKIFYTRLTFHGYCCTFNYLKKTSALEKNLGFKYTEGTQTSFQKSGMENGLRIIINNDPEDYVYTTLASIGVNIHIFNPAGYPDKSSGSLTELMVPMGVEAFVEIVPTIMGADQNIKKFPVEKRRCVFASEQKTEFGMYTQNDCYVDCRIKNYIGLCQCVPFVIPINQNLDVCTFSDLACLTKYKNKLVTAYPHGTTNIELSKERLDGLMCDNVCYSACETTQYKVSTHSGYFKNNTNLTVVHIYYSSYYGSYYKIDVMYEWYEILSSFGALFGITMGLSIISLIEFVFFTLYKTFVYSKL